jgi:hypothetical protein
VTRAIFARVIICNSEYRQEPVLQTQGRFELQFEVNGQEYFLAFVEDEKRWFLFSPRSQEMLRLPVYIDAANFEGSSAASLHLAS